MISGALCAGLGGAAAANPVFCEFTQSCVAGVCESTYARAVLYEDADRELILFWEAYEKPITLERKSTAEAKKKMFVGNVPGFFFYTEPDGTVVMSDRISAVAPRMDYEGHCARRFE